MKLNFDIDKLKTPCYVIDVDLLKENLIKLQYIIQKTNCKILLAQKAFSCYKLYPLIGKYLNGTTSSGLFEAKLSYEEMQKENHIFSPAYNENEFDEILSICDHIVFNSFKQWQKFKATTLKAKKSAGIRINPEHSTQEHSIYDPCAPFSRLGVTKQNFNENLLEGIEGLHFHCLCEQNYADLESTVYAIEKNFEKYLYNMKWLNFGGGHHITKNGYDIEKLINLINRIQKKYNLTVYLEPGEAVVLNCGYLISSVKEIVNNGMNIAILDTSAACHMPDVIEMPYRPPILNADLPEIKPYTYRLSSNTCLAGDVVGDYSFDKELSDNDKIIFCDMALYTMVKNNTFNGINLPSIYLTEKKHITLINEFNYIDFKSRL
jgi:carboxynorspermidine decarboxylase